MKKIIFISGVTFHIPKIIKSLKKISNFKIKILSTSHKTNFFLDRNDEFNFIPMVFKIFSRIFDYNNSSIERIVDNITFRFLSKFTKIKENDIIYGCSSFSREVFLKAKNNFKILDVANIHVDELIILLKSEHEKFNLKFKYSNYMRCVEQEEYRLADKIIVPSNRSLYSFTKNGVDKKKLIKGFFIPLMKRNIVKKKFKNNNNIKLGYIGGNILIKGLYYLLKSLNSTSNKSLTLNMCIPQNYIENNFFLKSEFNSKIMSSVGFTKNINTFYSKIDYLVVPSISDGFAQVVQEALSMSVPVICSNAVGASEYLDKNLGHIFQSKSTEELTKILDNLNKQDLNDKISNIYKHYITFENKIKSDQKKIINLLKTIN